LVSFFKCTASLCQFIHICCIDHTALSCILLSTKCHWGVFSKSDDNQTMPVNYDVLHKVLPLVNIVKVTLHAFIRVGSELALDEASVAYSSLYGHAVIFFNPIMNCGKFHFHLYLICCATMFARVRMKVATNNNSDGPDPHESMGTIYNTSLISNLNKLVMEICKLARGTVRKNHRMVPAVIFVFGSTYGNPVYMLSTADGLDQLTNVSLHIGKDKRDVPVPNTVKACMTYMRGVDHRDQLREMLSLMKSHGFNKKWYVKMWLALIEIPLTNASICYFLATPELKEGAVVVFMQ
jgi:hypothetical protein